MPNELEKIDFHGDAIFAFQDEETGEIFVSVREICNSLGLNFSGQYTKLTSDPVYSESLRNIAIQTPGGKQVQLCTSSNLVQGWLFSIQTNRLKPEIREKHIAYKKECFKVLNNYFTTGEAINPQVLESLTERVEQLEQKLSNKSFKVPSLSQQKKNILHEKARNGILEAISTGGKTTDELYAHFNRNISAQTLHAALSTLVRENLITALLQATLGRPATLYQST